MISDVMRDGLSLLESSCMMSCYKSVHGSQTWISWETVLLIFPVLEFLAQAVIPFSGSRKELYSNFHLLVRVVFPYRLSSFKSL